MSSIDAAAAEAHVAEQVARVSPNVEKWASLADSKKLEYLRDALVRLERLAEEWGNACNVSRRYNGVPHMESTGFLFGPTITAVHLQQLVRTYEALAKTGKPPVLQARRKVGTQEVVGVYPLCFGDKLLGIQSELWLEPGKPATQGACRKRTGVCAILSPGNYEAPLDVLHKMFVESKVAVYARHANLSGSNTYIEKVFARLVEDGFLSIVDPGIPYAAALVQQEKVDEVLMTGGCATFDKIVWGSEEAKAAGNRRVTKPVEAELGAVSPFIVVPSDSWTEKELLHWATALASWKLANSSSVCASPQLLIVSAQWKHRARFMELLVEQFEKSSNIPVFYPGTHDRVNAAAEAYGEGKPGSVYQVKSFAGSPDNIIKPIIVQGLTEADIGTHSCKTEAFAPVLAELAVEAADEEAFLAKVREIVNSERVFGSLSCSVVVHPDSAKKLGAPALDEWLAGMEWGTAAVNHWGGMGPLIGTGLWGAFPKHSVSDIQSGLGIINNYLMVDHAQKQVCQSSSHRLFTHHAHCPHRLQVMRSVFINPMHPKSVPSEKELGVAKAFTHYNAYPSVWRLLKLGGAVIRSSL